MCRTVNAAWAPELLLGPDAELLPVNIHERAVHRVGGVAARGVSEIVAGDHRVARRSKAFGAVHRALRCHRRSASIRLADRASTPAGALAPARCRVLDALTPAAGPAAARQAARSASCVPEPVPLPDDVAERIATYTPTSIAAAEWVTVRPLVTAVVADAAPATPDRAQHLMLPAVKLAVWAADQGVALARNAPVSSPCSPPTDTVRCDDGIEVRVGDRSIWVLDAHTDVICLGLATSSAEGYLLGVRNGQRRNIA